MSRILNALKNPQWTIPVVVFIAAQVFAWWITYIGNCIGVYGECWVRWDSALYLDIVEHGHTLFHCSPEQGYEIGSSKWCGNAGWAPLYPWLIRILSFLKLSPMWCGIILSEFFFLGYLFLTARIAGISSFKVRNWLMVLIPAFCPGNIYFHAVFPLSQAVFFMALLILFLQKEKFLWAGIAGFLGILSYGIGFFLLAALGIYGVVLFSSNRKQFAPFALGTLLPSLGGLLTLFAYDQWKTGHWNAMFLIQEKYGHGLNSPIKVLGIRLERLFNDVVSLRTWIEVQNLFVFVLVLVLCVLYWKQVSGGITRWFFVLYLFLFWFLPYSAGPNTGLYRNAAMLGPGYAAPLKLPIWLLWTILGISFALSTPMGMLFIRSWII